MGRDSESIRPVPEREAENAARLEALREAARVGFDALDRGEFKEFEDFEALERYLLELSEQVITRGTE